MSKEWLPSAGNLDEIWAHKNLIKLSEAEAKKMFTDNPSTYTELLTYVGGSLLVVHIKILIDYLMSDELRGNFALADGFIDLCLNRSDFHKYLNGQEISELKSAINFVANRQEFYDADSDIFGSFKLRIAGISI